MKSCTIEHLTFTR